MAVDIVLKDRNGDDVTYSGIETVTFDTPEDGVQATFTHGALQEGKEVELALADGDQAVTADDGYFLKKLTIKKPETLLPENIRSGVVVAGVTGDLIGDTEETTVDLDMADGDQTITPSADTKVLSKVVVTKPETLVPENIRAGIDIGGVVGECSVIEYLETDILPLSTQSFSYSSGYNLYMATSIEACALTVGETYLVVWDGTTYECVAQDAGDGGVSLTNDVDFTITAYGTYEVYLALANTESTHDIRIYQVSRSDAEELTVELDFPAGSEETDVLAETTYSDFAMDSTYGVYAVDTEVPYTLTIGETYIVVWDGETHECVCQDASALVSNGVALGNAAGWGLSGNDEPFAIATTNQGTAITGSITDTEAGGSHTIRIYQVTEGGTSDMVVEPSEDSKVMSKVTVIKPETLIPENIAKGVEIGGVTGDYVTDGTTKEIEPDFSEGDQTVTAEGDERWNEVVVKIPETLVPENIAKDVEIAGVVGTFSGADDLGTGAYYVKVIDYDGTILAEKNLDNGEVFTLPDAPEHEGLVFDGWSSSATITDNTVTVENNNIMIGPMYHTESGATEIDIVLTKATGLTFTFLDSRLSGMTSIDWGDGTTDSTLTHTYSDYGEYTIKIYGMTAIAAGNNATSGGGIVLQKDCTIIRVRIASGVTSLGVYSFYFCYSLESITLSSSVTYIGANAFQACRRLTGIVIPTGVTTINTSVMQTTYSLTSAVIPSGVTSIGTYAFWYCCNLSHIAIPSGVTVFNNRIFSDCNSLSHITIPSGVTSIGTYAFYSCHNISPHITFPSKLTSIGNNAFYECSGVKEYDFTACTGVPTLGTSAFPTVLLYQILVPSSLYSTWIAATNWSTYADYIVAV